MVINLSLLPFLSYLCTISFFALISILNSFAALVFFLRNIVTTDKHMITKPTNPAPNIQTTMANVFVSVMYFMSPIYMCLPITLI